MITVFTPTYNRAKMLANLYDSLLKQTYRDFEWLIVDDGSTDMTEEEVKSWQKEEKIEICYYKQANGGKHRAINKGVQMARGDFFFIVDSDDYLPANSLQLVAKHSSQIAEDYTFCGVAANRSYPDGRRIGGDANFDILNTDSVSFREKFHYKGDMAEVFKTEILRKYPFPEFEGEKFLTEAVVWNRIAKKYKLRYFNANIYICDYLPEGLSNNIRRHHRNSPLGTMLYYSSLTKDKRYGLKRHILDAISYWRYTWNYKGKRILPPYWVWLFFPIGVIVYFRDINKENKKL